MHNILVIGAGHNGLVAAAYLAKAGRRVLVLERRGVVGGCAVTEETWPGFKVSTASYVNSLFRPEIIRDLDLKRHGFAMIPRSPSSFTPLPDGRHERGPGDSQLLDRKLEIVIEADKDTTKNLSYGSSKLAGLSKTSSRAVAYERLQQGGDIVLTQTETNR